MTFISICIWVLFGLMAAFWAKNRGRSPLAWFFLGAVFGVFGIAALFLLPIYSTDKKSEEAIFSIEETEKPSFFPMMDWFYVDSEKKICGPESLHHIKILYQEKKLTNKSWVWHESLIEWKRIDQVPDMIQELHVT